MWFSDKVHFYLRDYLNSRNYIYWASENPDEVIERNLHTTKATAWVALSVRGIIGPFWFCNELGTTETVMTDCYLKILSFGDLLLGFVEETKDQQWFM